MFKVSIFDEISAISRKMQGFAAKSPQDFERNSSEVLTQYIL